MTHATIAGILICDLIVGRENPWTKLYDPSRITLKAAPEFLKEVGNMSAQYLDYFDAGDVQSINVLTPGQGAIINMKGKKVAVYKDESRKVHTYSAICPHMGCVLQWNGDEKTFDCPCHGSRFSKEGTVINGPALSNLERIEIR